MQKLEKDSNSAFDADKATLVVTLQKTRCTSRGRCIARKQARFTIYYAMVASHHIRSPPNRPNALCDVMRLPNSLRSLGNHPNHTGLGLRRLCRLRLLQRQTYPWQRDMPLTLHSPAPTVRLCCSGHRPLDRASRSRGRTPALGRIQPDRGNSLAAAPASVGKRGQLLDARQIIPCSRARHPSTMINRAAHRRSCANGSTGAVLYRGLLRCLPLTTHRSLQYLEVEWLVARGRGEHHGAAH